MMQEDPDRRIKLRQRQRHEDLNLFSRIPATYAIARKQGEQILRRAAGLSTVEWRVLWDLAEAGPLTIQELALIQRSDHSLLSRALPGMKDKGLVTATRSATDGRKTIIGITELGRDIYQRAAPFMKKRREAARALFAPEELAALFDYLDRLEAFLQRPIDETIGFEALDEDCGTR